MRKLEIRNEKWQMTKIRLAKVEDSAALAQIQVNSYRIAYAGLLPQEYLDHFSYEEQTQDWKDLLGDTMTDVLYVAENATGDIVGYAVGRPGLTNLEGYDCELVSLHVRRDDQRQGIGRRLFTATAAWLQARGCTSLMMWVLKQNPSRAFYEQLGGKLIGEQTIMLGDDVQAIEVAYGWPEIARVAS